MLKKYRSKLLIDIQDLEYPIKDFDVVEEEKGIGIVETKVSIKNSGLYFSFLQNRNDYNKFSAQQTLFRPVPPVVLVVPVDKPLEFIAVEKEFINWLNQEAKQFFDEVSEVDLWELYKQGSAFFEESSLNVAFNEVEKQQVKTVIDEYRVFILDKVQVNEVQLKSINDKLDYLIEATSRQTKTDWKGIAISTVLSVITTLSVDTNTGNELWNYFVHLFHNIPQLLSSSK